MNGISLSQPAQKTMSSREIAELTGKENFNVKRDCEVMFRELGIDALKFEAIYLDRMNRQQTEYLLPRDLVETLITGYSIKLRHAVIKRLRQLEEYVGNNSPALPNFSDPVAAARAWADEYEAKQIALEQVAVLEPKAQALDTIAETENTYTIRECAKTIGIKEKDLISLLLRKEWCYRDNERKLQPHADKVQSGIFINRASPVVKSQSDGRERVFLHMRVTAFGLTRITGLVNKQKGEAA